MKALLAKLRAPKASGAKAQPAMAGAPRARAAKRPARRPARRALWVIAGLFMASGLVRAADGAQGLSAEILSRAAEGALVEAAAPPPGPCAAPPDLEALFSELRAREARVAEQEKALEGRERAAAIAGEEIALQLADLQAAEAALAATLARAETAAEDDLARLTQVYENMKPKEAAPLFEQMDPGFAAGFLGRMRPDAAAAIMAGLSPPAAYSISVILAGRNAAAPTQ